MDKWELVLELTEQDFYDLIARFHFQRTDYFRISSLYHACIPLVKGTAWVQNGKKEELSFAPYEQYAAVILTLSKWLDEQQNLYQSVGAMTEAYMLECIGMLLLERGYQKVEQKIRKNEEIFVGAYTFLGDEVPVEKMKEFLCYVGTDEITCNSSYMLSPLNSVAYLIELLPKRAHLGKKTAVEECCFSCQFCRNKSCENRMTK